MGVTIVHSALNPDGETDECAPIRRRGASVVAIGKFDGIHCGHRALLSRLLVEARQRNCQAGVVTFDAHPGEVLRAARPGRLTTLPERAALCAEIGVDLMLVLKSTPALYATEADAFAAALIVALDVRAIVVGVDFRFGCGARGDVDTLRAVAARYGVSVIGVDLDERSGRKVSSTRIREHLNAGQIEQAVELLGRPYSVSGSATQVATRNIVVEVAERAAMPAPGTYSGRLSVCDRAEPVVIHVGAEQGGRSVLQLLRLGRHPRRVMRGTPCTVLFEQSTSDASGSDRTGESRNLGGVSLPNLVDANTIGFTPNRGPFSFGGQLRTFGVSAQYSF